MDKTLKTITELANAYQDRSVWERFETGSRASQKFSVPRQTSPPTGKRRWITTNSEYGRFQPWGSVGGNSGSVSRAEDLVLLGTTEVPHRESRGASCVQPPSRRSTAGIKLPPIEEDKRPGSKTTSATKEPEATKAAAKTRLSPSLGIPPPPARKRLTTGVAKSYMMNECGRFWQNMQTVAEDAGLDLRTRGGSRADVLTIPDRELAQDDDLLLRDDEDAYSHSVPSLDGSEPPSPTPHCRN